MAHAGRLRKVGGSVMLAIPPAFLDALDLTVGAAVGLSIADGALVVAPIVGPRYTLDDLLAACADDAPEDPAARDWLDAPTAGRELL